MIQSERLFDSFARLHKSAFMSLPGGSGEGGGVGSGEKAPYQKKYGVYASFPYPVPRAFDTFCS